MMYDEWLRMSNPWVVVDAASESDEACQAALTRIIDTMLELQLDFRHKSPGFQPFSVTALTGEVPGGGGRSDQTMLAALRYHPDSEWHKACGGLLRRLPKRQAAAMLLQAARVRPEKVGQSIWMVTARQMVERQETLLQSIGFCCENLLPSNEEMAERLEGLSQEEIEAEPRATHIKPFETVKSLQDCAFRARTTLRKWLKQQEIKKAA